MDRPKRVIVWQNGMVMVFGHDRQQMPEYQGRYEEVRERLAAVKPEYEWERLDWHRDRRRVVGE